jgi:AmiR/NasT family two-component response regulator
MNQNSSSDKFRIVVAEDETLIRMDLVEMLTESGYEVVGQGINGQEAIDLANTHKPDLVILDVKMPVLDGISAAEKIINLCPVLMLTAFSQRELVERARDTGVMAYVVKPFTINDLLPAIEISISRYRQMKSLEVEVADLYERLETRKVLDRAKGILMKAAMDRRISMKEVAQGVISPSDAPQQ